MRKAIIIPSHRAEATLPDVLAALPQELLAGEDMVVLVNDASPDATGKVADRLAGSNDRVFALHHAHNRGYGGALKTGMRFGLEQGAELFAVVHADGQYAPQMVLRLCEPIEHGITEIVQGSRMKAGGARLGAHPMPLSRYVPNRMLTLLENLVVGTNLAEFHSGYMVYSKKLLERVPFEAIGENYNFDAEMIILAHMIGIRTVEIPIPTRYDDATSSLAPIPYGLNVLRMMWRVMTGHYRELLDRHGLEGRDSGGRVSQW
jgi:glycosyltransferase involved in cell wall biosynthesis